MFFLSGGGGGDSPLSCFLLYHIKRVGGTPGETCTPRGVLSPWAFPRPGHFDAPLTLGGGADDAPGDGPQPTSEQPTHGNTCRCASCAGLLLTLPHPLGRPPGRGHAWQVLFDLFLVLVGFDHLRQPQLLSLLLLCSEHVFGQGEAAVLGHQLCQLLARRDRKSTRLNSSHVAISYAVFCLKRKSLSIS